MSAPNYIRPGSRLQEFPAGTTNWLIENVKLLLAERGGRSSNGLSALHQVLMKNEHTEDINSPFGVLALDGPLNDPADFEFEPYNGIKLRGIAPEAEEDRFAILQNSTNQGGVTPAIVSGPTWVLLEVVDEEDNVCGPIADDTSKLKSGIGTTPILWKEDGTGEKWAVVQLGAGSGGGSAGGGWAILVEDCIGAISTLDVDDQGVASGQIHLGGALNINGAPIAGALAYKLERKYPEEPDPTVVGWDLIYVPSNQEVRLFTMVGAKTAKGKTVQYKIIEGRAVIDVEDCAI